MKFQLFARLSALSSFALLNVRTCYARDDSAFPNSGKKKNAKIGRSLDGIFQDPSQESGTTAQENLNVIEESSTEGSDVVAAIVGGNNADPQEYPFFVWLGNCGGSLVAPDVVLSAAHCELGANSFVSLGMHSKRVGSGADFLNIEHIPIERSEVHPQYNFDTFENDVWMIKLQWPSQLYANQVVDLETPADDVLLTPGNNLQAMGFGLLTDGGVTPNVLQEVTLDFISSAACNAAYPGEILPGMFCTDTTNGVDTCNGDSGGPLIHVPTNKQVGIVSWSNNGCAPNSPAGVNQRVRDHFDFISGMMSTWAATGKAGKRPRNNGCTDNGGFYHDDKDVDEANLVDVTYNCLWYAQSGSKRCQWYGSRFPHAGVTANNACCACGGGTRVNAKASKRI